MAERLYCRLYTMFQIKEEDSSGWIEEKSGGWLAACGRCGRTARLASCEDAMSWLERHLTSPRACPGRPFAAPAGGGPS